MSWEERLLFLMFLDHKGALKKWERNHNEQTNGSRIDFESFSPYGGFDWSESEEGNAYWGGIINNWYKSTYGKLEVASLDYEIKHTVLSNTIEVGCQRITKEDALKIADFIYECFGEDE